MKVESKNNPTSQIEARIAKSTCTKGATPMTLSPPPHTAIRSTPLTPSSFSTPRPKGPKKTEVGHPPSARLHDVRPKLLVSSPERRIPLSRLRPFDILLASPDIPKTPACCGCLPGKSPPRPPFSGRVLKVQLGSNKSHTIYEAVPKNPTDRLTYITPLKRQVCLTPFETLKINEPLDGFGMNLLQTASAFSQIGNADSPQFRLYY
jgi:hypothetical protein